MFESAIFAAKRQSLILVMAFVPLGSVILLSSACATKPTNYARPIARTPRAPKPAAPPRNPPASGTKDTLDYADSGARMSLRERAINVLANAAAGASPEQRANALEGLASVPTRLEPILRAALNDESPAVRAVAATLVGREQLTTSASFVQPLTSDNVVFVQASALYALRRCGLDADITPFAGFLEHPSPKVRSHVAYLLGELRDASALGLLREAAADPMSRASPAEVRLMQVQIAEARVKLGDESALHELRAALFPARNEDLETTALAAQIVGEITDHASTNQLINLTALVDGSGKTMPPEVRLAAAGSLAKLGLPKGAFLAREYAPNPAPALRAQAAYVLGQTAQTDNLADLDILLNDDSPLVQVAAAAAILKITSGGR